MTPFLRITIPVFAVLVILASCRALPVFSKFGRNTTAVETEFSRGVNLSEWFQYTGSAHGISFTKFTKQDFENLASLGVDVIRLPIQFNVMTGDAPDYPLDPLLFELLDQVIDWAEEYHLYIILDNHSSDGSNGQTPDDIDTVLIPLWAQVAEHYAGRSNYVLYEILNEPYGGITAERWGKIQGDVIDTIRTKDTKHTIVVGGHQWNSIGSLGELPVYADQNLLYTFHFYDPHIFTHQGASWSGPGLENLREVPFPANAHKMPAAPQELRGTWVEDQLRNYAREADIKVLAASIDAAVKFSNDRGVPIFCGEFGVYMINSLQADRVRWYQTITRLLDERHIARTSWDYFGGFGVYKTARGGDFHSDLNTGVVKALGFTPPIQRPPEKLRDGFFLYDDYALQGIALRHWGESLLDLYDSDAAAEGNYSVSWKNIGRYDSFFFEFNRPIDWQYLASSGYALQFKARTEQPVEFDLRFLDSEDGARIPWRMRYTITETRLPPDGEWHTIRIPLSDMKEHGAWVNDPALPDGGTWHNPRGLFSWDAIVRLDVAAEERALPGCTIWFDAVQITR